MIQDIAPHIYHNEMSWKQADLQDYVLQFAPDRTLLAALEGDVVHLPTVAQTGLPQEQLQYLFSIDDRAYYLADDEAHPALGQPFGPLPTGTFRGLHLDETLFACAAAESLWRWYSGNRFCGHCGGKLEKSPVERAMVCPVCGNTIYPKICPAVIVAVHNGDKLLLTRYRNRPFKQYALVAGFNEIGESIEDTVRREVLEETGVRVKNLQFYKSQPWVFTDSLLFGFYAELEGSDAITIQEDELAEAVWMPRDQLPRDEAHVSLTAEMIEGFRLGKM